MSVVAASVLKGYFLEGLFPTEGQFATVVDTLLAGGRGTYVPALGCVVDEPKFIDGAWYRCTTACAPGTALNLANFRLANEGNLSRFDLPRWNPGETVDPATDPFTGLREYKQAIYQATQYVPSGVEPVVTPGWADYWTLRVAGDGRVGFPWTADMVMGRFDIVTYQGQPYQLILPEGVFYFQTNDFAATLAATPPAPHFIAWNTEGTARPGIIYIDRQSMIGLRDFDTGILNPDDAPNNYIGAYDPGVYIITDARQYLDVDGVTVLSRPVKVLADSPNTFVEARSLVDDLPGKYGLDDGVGGVDTFVAVGGGGVQTVTGTGVNNGDPLNPVITSEGIYIVKTTADPLADLIDRYPEMASIGILPYQKYILKMTPSGTDYSGLSSATLFECLGFTLLNPTDERAIATLLNSGKVGRLNYVDDTFTELNPPQIKEFNTVPFLLDTATVNQVDFGPHVLGAFYEFWYTGNVEGGGGASDTSFDLFVDGVSVLSFGFAWASELDPQKVYISKGFVTVTNPSTGLVSTRLSLSIGAGDTVKLQNSDTLGGGNVLIVKATKTTPQRVAGFI
jgi:hypothetical protein